MVIRLKKKCCVKELYFHLSAIRKLKYDICCIGMYTPFTHGVREEFFEIGWLKHLHNEHQRTHGRSRHQDPSLELKSDHQRWLGSWLKRVMSAWKWSGCAVGFKGFQSMGREAAKKVEGWEIRRMGDGRICDLYWWKKLERVNHLFS